MVLHHADSGLPFFQSCRVQYSRQMGFIKSTVDSSAEKMDCFNYGNHRWVSFNLRVPTAPSANTRANYGSNKVSPYLNRALTSKNEYNDYEIDYQPLSASRTRSSRSSKLLIASVREIRIGQDRDTIIKATTNVSTTTAESVVATTSSSTTTTTMTITTAISTPSTTSSVGVGVGVLTTGSQWFGTRRIILNCSATITNLTITITVKKAVNASYSGMWCTISGLSITQSHVDNGAQIIYTWNIMRRQTVPPGNCPYTL
ncbi:unnamed protein product [Rotaria magnacalcarata]|uniref:Uncharacterized protein n=2 Tax=Rotaria magnacalcarata TaxID=392030 RepID=A0A819CK96_9BILA|nr:unnamed protein product [Rotaria magnacalcarata]